MTFCIKYLGVPPVGFAPVRRAVRYSLRSVLRTRFAVAAIPHAAARLIFGLLLFSGVVFGQNTAKNQEIFKKLTALKGNYHLPHGEKYNFSLPIVALAFAETPYVANTLDQSPEKLIIRLDAVDCITFVEYVMAANRARSVGSNLYTDFEKYIQQLRYRNGKISGYGSRIHYLSEWLAQATQNGWLTPVTTAENATKLVKKVNFMSTHAAKYPALKSAKTLAEIIASEKRLSSQPVYYWTADELRNKNLQPGDMIAFVSATAGLDYGHCGFSLRNNTMVHASQKEKKVVATTFGISEYILSHKQFIGAAIFRPAYNKHNI